MARTQGPRVRAFDLVDHVRRLPPAEGGLVAGERVVLALSGGADSVALLDVFVKLGVDVVAAHLDHGLRHDSAEDARFCQALCNDLHVPCVAERADVAAWAAQTGAGIEAAGREARYAFLERVRVAHEADRIATAHHLDDHVESVLMALGRGTGLRGLQGIVPTQDRLVRPLRAVRRIFLQNHLIAAGIPWREDPSNADTERQRNLMRHNVLPTLETAFGDRVFERIGALGARAREDVGVLSELVGDRLDAITRVAGDGRLVLDREGFLDASPGLRSALVREAARRLFATGSHQRWNADHVAGVLAFVQRAHAGQRWSLPGGGRLAVERDRLILSAASDEQSGAGPETRTSGGRKLVSELLPGPGHGCSFSEPLRAFVDAAGVRPPFVLRPVLPGDRMQPHGMDGHKKIVTLLSERGVPRERRGAQLVVCDRERIVWAVGLTTCQRARIGEGTRRVWHLRVEDGGDVPLDVDDA